jgi:polyphenol oxidase
MGQLDFILPNWPAPANVKALQTTRVGGVSVGLYTSLNLGAHVGDNHVFVEHNRQLLAPYLPSSPVWINQVHGIKVINASSSMGLHDADASYSKLANVVCATMTADCLPVLLCDTKGTVVAAVHAGWRGLCDGVIEAAVHEMAVPASEVLAWLGPAIGPQSFEVGDDVRTQFIAVDPRASHAFKPHADKWLCDLYLLAKQRLQSVGVSQIYGATINTEFCTYSEGERFYSFRRDNVTGRMASLIWLESI